MAGDLRMAQDVAEAVGCWIPSTDGCCHCGDCECDGIGCIANLDPDDEADHDAIEELHMTLREGRAWQFLLAQMVSGMSADEAYTNALTLLANANNQ